MVARRKTKNHNHGSKEKGHRKLHKYLHTSLKLFVVAIVWAFVSDLLASRRARFQLHESKVALKAGNVLKSRQAFDEALALYDWSLVRPGSPAASSAHAALSRLLRLPLLATGYGSAWSRLGTRLRSHAARIRRYVSTKEEPAFE
mmetsp:Transcript_8840/g.12302  ORF Transcript_8840/g.12302 Transcript_8840/m.12302 type:complete len:145 (-) Transcript_8840:127-561(-)